MRSVRTLLFGLIALALVVPIASADHIQANCPLSFVGASDPASPFFLSPHGTFRNGSLVYILRGQTLTTLNITDVGTLEVAREDFISTMANRDEQGGVAYLGGFMYVSGERGIEIFDLRNVRGGVGGNAPILISRTATPHYRRLAVHGNLLAALFPADDLPCAVNGTAACRNQIDIYGISNLTAPTLMGSIVADNRYIGFNDIAWANNFLYATGYGGTFAFDVSSRPSSPFLALSRTTLGKFLVTNGTSVLGIGQDTLIGVFTVGPQATLTQFRVFTLPSVWDRSMDLMFHPEAYIDDFRLVTLIDERDPYTRLPARSIAFDVFDFSVPQFEGADDRVYENVTPTFPDEIKYHPLLVGAYVHVIGEISGHQKWGACDLMAGKVAFDFLKSLPCGGTQLHGVITGKNKITSVELFLDGRSLGFATLGDERTDFPGSPTPVRSFRISVNLDAEPRGNHLLRAVGTDIFGNRKQFYAQEIFFPGPGENCTTRKRGSRR